jgi:hypothetical protein
MAKIRKRTRAVRMARKPACIGDKENQEKWIKKFIGILKRDYADLDPAIHAILSDERRAKLSTTKIRSYVDKNCTNWWYRDIKVRGAEKKRQLEQAIAGLNIAASLYLEKGDQATAAYLNTRAIELSQVPGRWKEAFATKPHGRDLDHSFLLSCQSFLETELGHPVTYVTLANLVTAGYEADGSPLEVPITEEQIRKNLTNFKRNVPHWHLDSSMN